ncbi:MAG: PspC domain-containing protein [Bacteroides sp.]|nr:PspC domain-containing protein [Bacteroides sp.]
MKKTLTVNLGGTVFHIDEDAYRLLDDYLNNLRMHFSKSAGADEIVDDIERRISELFSEKLVAGQQVITMTDVEAVISRMGKPEEMEADDESDGAADATRKPFEAQTEETDKVHRRFFRNPDDKMLGGVISGTAAYFGWDVTLLRLLMVVLCLFSFEFLIPAYIICWLIIPEARTAAEKLSMRGEAVTVENIGKTVTDGFDKMNDYVNSGKPQSMLRRIGMGLVDAIGWMLKIGLVVLAVICSPLLFVFAVVFVVLLVAGISLLIGGGTHLFTMLPIYDICFTANPLGTIAMFIAGILMVGIPLLCLVFVIFRPLFRWQPMVSGLKWTLLILWVVSTVVFFISFFMLDVHLPEMMMV